MLSILSLFALKGTQLDAASRLEAHLAVTAGAGSGKTRALVARYLNFVEQGVPLRSLVAITFTEKAAREMRSRIRREIENWLALSPLPSGAVPTGEGSGVRAGDWQTAFIELDSARIGTIHSLCADLLRLYPAEAGVDPRFTVLEEGLAATLQAQAVEATLAWAATNGETARLFAFFKERELERILQSLIAKRLDAVPLFLQSDPLPRWETALARWLDDTLASPAWAGSLEALTQYASPRLVLSGASRKPDDKLEIARRSVLAGWSAAQSAKAAKDWDATFTALSELRAAISTGGQKGNWDADALEAMRAAMKDLRDEYDENIAPLIPSGGCSWALDRQAADLLPALRRLFERALAEYQTLKDDRHALDFDDLEDRAVHLLNSPLPPGAVPVGEGLGVRAVLVDEFQDTNDRQRQIVYALARFEQPDSANLFIVGDAKQSIYRFRNADVTVFRNIQSDIARRGGQPPIGAIGGQTFELDLTFRAHQPLLDLVERLLTPLMGSEDDPDRPHYVPFAPLTAHRQGPAANTRPPFVEFHLGAGDADAGRRAAAWALAARLRELRAKEGFAWEDMALLFRASNAFPYYEDALEAAGVPFVTVAGKGFYDRPEIRDLLNALTALADPTDDLALAGLLRSPAFALADADLYRLRFPDGETPQPLYQSLRFASSLQFSSIAETLSTLHDLAGRLPVAELLKHFLDCTHYRAILKSVGPAERLSRNVDKLLADAHRSRLVAVGDFLEYVASLRDVGAREGEAPADPSASSEGGAVQLMTIHKSKGLEFPLVVIADAGYEHRGGRGPVHLDDSLGVLLKLTADKAQPFAWQLGALADDDRAAAEDLRLLYVALTRAKEKVLISGQIKISASQKEAGKPVLSGWLKQLGGVIGLDQCRLPDLTGQLVLALDSGWADSLMVTLTPPPTEVPAPATVSAITTETPAPGPLITPLPHFQTPVPSDELPTRVWRVAAPPKGGVAAGREAPAWVVGKLVHEALRRWTFTDLEAQLRPVALETGLTDDETIAAALGEARQLLDRFRAHPLFAEMDGAIERHHEVPYVLGDDEGIMDVLYRGANGWTVADFKTDDLRDEAALDKKTEEYRPQMKRYLAALAARAPAGQRPRACLIFLNMRQHVRLVPVAETGIKF